MKMAYLSEEQLRRLLENVPNEKERLMFLVTYWHGLRISETLSLTPRHLQSGYVKMSRLKGSKSTVQPLMLHPDPLLTEAGLLAIVQHASDKDERIFPITRFKARKLMRKYGKAAGLPEPLLHPHALKHSVAKHGLARGMTLPDLQALLGHKSLSSTGEYLKVSDQEASAALYKAMGVMNPLDLSATAAMPQLGDSIDFYGKRCYYCRKFCDTHLDTSADV